jgi:aspartate carbamoyltransferase catalytic subunit
MDIPQQSFLRDAMRRLNLTRDQFSDRIAVKRRTLDSWLAREGSADVRTMPASTRLLVERLLQDAGIAVPTIEPLPVPGFGGSHHLLSVRQFDRVGLERLFTVADVMQPYAMRQSVTRVLEGAVLANLFFEASTRTRLSFGTAFARLGGVVLDTTGFTFSSVSKGESLVDTARVVAGYADAIVLRHPEEGAAAAFAEVSNVPVINGGDGPGEHPSQALLDVYTIQREFSFLGKTIDGATVAITGDLRYGRTVHSLVRLLSLYENLTFSLCSPRGLELPSSVQEAARQGGHTVSIHKTPAAAVRDADVLYVTRIQRERFEPGSIEPGLEYRIDRSFVEQHLAENTIVLHPLPRDSAPDSADLASDIVGDSRLAIFRQADNGVAVRMAIFAETLGVTHLVGQTARPATWFAPATPGTQDVVFAAHH